MDASLSRITALIADELGLDGDEVIEALEAACGSGGRLANGPVPAPSDQSLAQAAWELLAARKPDAFAGGPADSTAVGYAYRYAVARTPWALAAVALAPPDRELLRTTRSLIAGWAQLGPWPRVRHVTFSPECVALDATVALRRAYSGGFAFTWHPGLRRIALYPESRVAEYYSMSPGTLVSVLLHEEFHLTTAARHRHSRFGLLGTSVFEAAAEVIQMIASLICSGYEPTLSELREYLAEVGNEPLLEFIDAVECRTVAEVTRAIAALAVAAPAGDETLVGRLGHARATRLRLAPHP